jgi:hypothetical protein
MSTLAEILQNIQGAAKDPQFWSDVGSNAASVASKPAQIMQGALPAIYSTAGSVKRRLGDVLTNPVLNAQRTMGQASDDLRAVDQLQQQAFADQSNPLKPTDKRALAELVDKYMNTAGGFAPIGMTVYHGSPHKFDKFDSSKIGTGEGAQAYGHGLYLAESPDVARGYKDALSLASSKLHTPDGQVFDVQSVLKNPNVRAVLQKTNGDIDAAIARANGVIDSIPSTMGADYAAHDLQQLQKAKQLGGLSRPEGALYKVDLPDEHIAKMLDYDAALAQQSPEIKALAEQYGLTDADHLGGDLIAAMDAKRKAGALAMRDAGIPGIKYLDQSSRNAGEGTRNFVVFPGNEDLLQILERNGQPIAKPAQYDASKVNAIADQLHGEVNGFPLASSSTPSAIPDAEAGKLIPDALMPANKLKPINGIEDRQKFNKLVQSMSTNGWQGRPILVYQDMGKAKAITGSHRIAAARKLGLDVPVLYVNKDTIKYEDPNGLFGSFKEAINDGRTEEFLRAADDKRAHQLMNLEDRDIPIPNNFKYPREEALALAQRNAALPVEQGGLGLHPNNTPMERAQAMGFTDAAYHGTNADILAIDPSKYGSATGANSAKQAFRAVSDPTTARGYAEYAAKEAPVKSLINQADIYEKLAQKNPAYWDKYDDVLRQAEILESNIADSPLRGQNVMPLMLRTNNAKTMNAGGSEFVDLEVGINDFLKSAKSSGSDVARIENLADDVGFSGRPATHFGVLNPSIVRSKFAAFDPKRIKDTDLLAGALPFAFMGNDSEGQSNFQYNPDKVNAIAEQLKAELND